MQELERATLVERLARLKTYSFNSVSKVKLVQADIRKLERQLLGKPPRAVPKPKQKAIKTINWEKLRLASNF